jgi:uncharacterized membrane protein YraQ (UPF0718 family)
VLAAYAILSVPAPRVALRALSDALHLGGTVAALLAGIYLFLGLFEEWVSPEFLSRLIGREAGRARSLTLAMLFGAWGNGPHYVTYPIASLFLASGAEVATAVTFMSAWNVVKLVMVPFEIQFLGVRFALLRLAFCALIPAPAGLLTQAALRAFHAAPRIRPTGPPGALSPR